MAPKYKSHWWTRRPFGAPFSQTVVVDRIANALLLSTSHPKMSKKRKKVLKETEPFAHDDITSKGDYKGPFGDFYVHNEHVFAFPSEMTNVNWTFVGLPRSGTTRTVLLPGFPGQYVAWDTGSAFELNSEPLYPPVEFDSFTNDLNVVGSELIQRARPGNPVASVFQFIYELKDLPRLPLSLKHRLDRFRRAGDEYLNVQFGWIPFIKDLIAMYNLQRTLDNRLSQIIRDNNKGIRRRRKKKEETLEYVDAEVTLAPPDNSRTELDPSPCMLPRQVTFADGFKIWISPYEGVSDIPNGSSCVPFIVSYRLLRKTVTWDRFSGVFRYYIPDLGTPQWQRRAITALYGARLTPSMVWSVYPWSWLTDWFTNIGTVLSNASENAVDNCVLDNAFVMRDQEITYLVEAVIGFATALPEPTGSTSGNTVAASCGVKITRKLRTRANPFGFGSTFNSLSDYQTSILAALGISRARF